MNLNFKKQLTFSESIRFIDDVISIVFRINKETNETEYLPELSDYAYKLMIAKYYGGYILEGDADIDYSVAMQINPDELCQDGIIDRSQLDGIDYALSEKINMMKAEMNKPVSYMDAIMPPVIRLIDLLNEKVSAINTDEFNDALTKLIGFGNMDDLVNSYLNSEFADNLRNELLDEKSKKIIELEEKLKNQ